jgi:hypothetical protein
MKEFEGKKVAFFSTNCAMQEALQTAVLAEANAYYPQPCCPSPYHAFPGALGLEALQVGGDDTGALKQIAAKLAEHDAVGRFSTWPTPVNMSLIEVGVKYAHDYINGTITSKNDEAIIKGMFEEVAAGSIVKFYTDIEGNTYENYYTVLLGPVDFNDYL